MLAIGTFGIWELILIFAIAVMIFGAKKLPELGKGIGEGIHNFRNSLRGRDSDAEPEKEIPSSNEE